MRRRDLNQLTDREREVLELLRRDFTNEQIAQRLGISPDGAKYHVSQILSKLGVGTREEAAAWRREERRALWARWPLWAKLGPAGAAIAAGVGLVAVIAMGWGGHGDVENSLPGVAQAESGGHSSTRTSLMPIKSPTASESATPTPIAIVAQPTLVATPYVTIVENTEPPTPEESPAVTPTPSVSPDLPRGDLGFERFKAGSYSGIQTRGEVFKIETAEQWAVFWAAHTSTISPTPTLPPFDFTDRMLIAVVTSASSGGYSIRVDRVVESTSDLQVLTILREPGPNCGVTAAITQPYEIVSIQRSSRASVLTLLTEQGPACAPYSDHESILPIDSPPLLNSPLMTVLPVLGSLFPWRIA